MLTPACHGRPLVPRGAPEQGQGRAQPQRQERRLPSLCPLLRTGPDRVPRLPWSRGAHTWGLSRSRGFLCGLELISPVLPGLGVRAPGAAGYSPGLAPTWKFHGLHGSQAFPTDIIMERRTSRTSKSFVPFDLRTKRGHGGQALSFLLPALASGEGIWRGCSFLKIREWVTERQPSPEAGCPAGLHSCRLPTLCLKQC